MIFLEDLVLVYLIPLTLTMLLSLILFILFKKNQVGTYRENNYSFECGFNTFSISEMGFCIRFFNLAILFLFVDLEIAFLIPFFGGSHSMEFDPQNYFLNLTLIFILLIFILFLEKGMGGLSWSEEF